MASDLFLNMEVYFNLKFVDRSRRQVSGIIYFVTKYKEYFELMIKKNKALFEEFRNIHDRYGLEQEKLQEEFNKIGAKVQVVIRQWEDKLCGRSEGSGYASYSGNLAQKFQDEIRRVFPFVDSIGIIIESAPVSSPPPAIEPAFILKKISLH